MVQSQSQRAAEHNLGFRIVVPRRAAISCYVPGWGVSGVF
jgi:hypothetical protein